MEQAKLDILQEFQRVNDLLNRLDKNRSIIVVHPDKLNETVSVQGHEFTLREIFKAGHFKIREDATLADPEKMFLLDPSQLDGNTDDCL